LFFEKFVHVIIFVQCVAVRCVSVAIVGDGDKPPCVTGRVRFRAVIIGYHGFKNCRLCFPVKVKVMLSVPQSSLISSVLQFCVVALRNFIFIVVSGGHSFRGEYRRHRLALLCVFVVCTSNFHLTSFHTSATIFVQTTLSNSVIFVCESTV
jgi:hypothetical protein